MASSRLSVGVHVLALLALHRRRPLTSEYIAASVNTNPVVIRRLLGLLRQAGYVESQGGAGGGWTLARRPGEITLLDVRRAVQPESGIFELHRSPPNSKCPVGRNISRILKSVYGEAQQALDQRLARTTIRSVLGSIQRRAGA